MTLPKGYVIPNKEAEEKTKREAEEKTKREAEEKTKREAEEKTKREAEEKTRSKTVDPALVKPEGTPALVKPEGTPALVKPESSQMNLTTTDSGNVMNYYLLWDQLREAYLQTMKEATSSYFRLLDFWSQSRGQK
ncbi:hypothetical protein [Candidatus Nitrosocosmicus hydrocola]|uniref:hypothetical protein n=1 Tax=Candidatus Nitrosocosmicus hydrocola TaxID=1826872 RepID=UPI000B08402B|nr:hypothetical protein [Candidatus Nitrosocosmicus hydrocola]